MNLDQYFKMRADLVGHTLADRGEPFALSWRFYAAGLGCVVMATVAELWPLSTQLDPGFFARTSTFMSWVVLAGIWLLTIAQAAHVLLARATVQSRALVRERTLSQLLKIDSALAHKALQFAT